MTREEAIKVANEMHGWVKTDREKEALETLIPELRESDDERIRKAMVDYFSQYKDDGLRGVDITPWIAYLENLKPSFRKIHDGVMWDRGLRTGIALGKKEQKSLNIGAASEWLRKHVCNYMNSEYNEFHQCVEYDGSIDKEKLINDFEKAMQKESLRDFIDDFPYSDEQKPINESNMHEPTLDEARKWNEAYEKGYSLGYENGRNEQKPAEWSKEDDFKLGALITDIETRSDLTETIKIKYVSFLKSLRLQPRQEWSEEDEAHRKFISESLEDQIRFCKKDAEGAYYAKQIRTAQNWLNDLPNKFSSKKIENNVH